MELIAAVLHDSRQKDENGRSVMTTPPVSSGGGDSPPKVFFPEVEKPLFALMQLIMSHGDPRSRRQESAELLERACPRAFLGAKIIKV